MKNTGKIAGLIALAAISAGIIMFMKKNDGPISSDGYIGQSCINIEEGRMTPEALLALGRLSDPQVSPDGQHILYGVSYTSVEDNRSVRNLFISNIDGSGRMQLTESGKSISNARWSADGKHIAFIMGGQVWTAGIDEKKGGWELSDIRQVTDVEAGVGEFKVSPDESMIMYISYVKSHVKSPSDCYGDLDKATAYETDDLMYRHWDHTVMEIPHTFIADFAFGMPEKAVTRENSTDILAAETELYELPTEPWSGLEQLSWSQRCGHDRSKDVFQKSSELSPDCDSWHKIAPVPVQMRIRFHCMPAIKTFLQYQYSAWKNKALFWQQKLPVEEIYCHQFEVCRLPQVFLPEEVVFG